MYRFIQYLKTGSVRARFSFLPLILVIALLIGSVARGQSIDTEEVDESNRKYSPTLSNIRTLVKANVLDLAQSILENDGPPSLPTIEWLNWQRQLWTLYRVRGNWEKLHQKIREIPPAFPAEIKKEAEIQGIYALIELDRGLRAREILRKRLLSSENSELEKRNLRKLMIESYLSDDLLEDASTAMELHQRDYRSQEQDWLLLSAQVYLSLNDPDTAVNLLAPLDQPSARLLRIFARLKNQSLSVEQAIHKSIQLLSDIEPVVERSDLRIDQVLSVIIFATQSSLSNIPAIEEIEKYLVEVGSENSSSNKYYPQFDVSDLLSAYSRYASDIANEAGLLTGENSRWFDHAIQLQREENLKKKAIYGHLLQNTEDEILKLQLNNAFITALIASNQIGVISSLFGEGNPFGELTLSGNVGFRLSNFALEQGNIKLAAGVNNRLTEIPQGMKPLDWLLHVARISIIAGDFERGTKELKSWLNAFENLQPEQTDQILQPIFDLQTVNKHELALELLRMVNSRSHSEKHNREIAYWIAESYQATRQYIKAADFYLYSALQKDDGFDQWGEAARFHAAEALYSANLVADSRVLFEGLLARATSETRRTQLKQKLQELWLLESSLGQIE